MVKLIKEQKPNGSETLLSAKDFPRKFEITAKKPNGGNVIKEYEIDVTKNGLIFQLVSTKAIQEKK